MSEASGLDCPARKDRLATVLKRNSEFATFEPRGRVKTMATSVPGESIDHWRFTNHCSPIAIRAFALRASSGRPS